MSISESRIEAHAPNLRRFSIYPTFDLAEGHSLHRHSARHRSRPPDLARGIADLRPFLALRPLGGPSLLPNVSGYRSCVSIGLRISQTLSGMSITDYRLETLALHLQKPGVTSNHESQLDSRGSPI